MRKRCFLAILLTAVVSLSGCDQLSQIASRKDSQKETQKEEQKETPVQTEQDIMIETNDGVPFIETETGAGTESSVPETESASGSILIPAEDETGMEFEDSPEDLYSIVPDTETETESPEGNTSETKEYPEPIGSILKEVISSREALGEHWSVGYEDLHSGEKAGYQETDVLQSASVVKLFIMGAVYRYMCYPPEGEEAIPFGEEYDGQLREIIGKMITVSDNDAANLLIDRLGGGDFTKGAGLIGEFCKENGYTGTSIGRRFLESNPTGDNYTTAADTRKFLSDLYHGTLVNEEASGKMLAFVKEQTRKNKIPSGLPEGFTSGNKTGEMPEGYNLGCIENDAAIVFPPEGQGEGYILTVLSNDLGGRNEEAIAAIREISALTAAWYQQK